MYRPDKEIFKKKAPKFKPQLKTFHPIEKSQSKMPAPTQQIKILTFHPQTLKERQKLIERSLLSLQNLPQFSIVSQNKNQIVVQIKSYTMQLLPWLKKKDSLFKINIVLGIFITYLELVEVYGIFPLHPNMMKVSPKQQVAIWINKNFNLNQPDQIWTKTPFSYKQFIKGFLTIFKCCLPNKKIQQSYSESSQLLNALVQLKKKEQIHKNCHQFIKHHVTSQTEMTKSRKSVKNQNSFAKNEADKKVQPKRFCTSKIFGQSAQLRYERFMKNKSQSPPKTSLSMSPKKNSQLYNTQKWNTKQEKKQKYKQSNIYYTQKKIDSDKQESQNNKSQIRPLSTTGDLFKKYLMYSSSKFQKQNKTQKFQTQYDLTPQKNQKTRNSERTFIFKSDVHNINSRFTTPTIMAKNMVHRNHQQSQIVAEQSGFSPISYRRKMSGGFTENTSSGNNNSFFGSGQFRKTPRFQAQSSFAFSKTSQLQGKISKNQSKEKEEKLKSSFPFKTASTLTSFRASNYTQKMMSSKSQENFSPMTVQIPNPPKKIEELGPLQEQNQFDNIQSDFNNIFSVNNSNVNTQQDEKKLQEMMSEFEGVLF